MVLPVKDKKTLIKPRALRRGDRVGLIAPSSRPATPAVVAAAERVMREMGFVPVLGNHSLSVHGYMAGTDNERLSDLRHFLEDPSIAGIFCLTGGFGAMHLLPFLDYQAIAENPKLVVGSDDNTVLLNAILERSGVVTFFGPNVDSIVDESGFENLKRAVTSKGQLPAIHALEPESSDRFGSNFYCAVEGDAEGHLVGGSLTSLISLSGTPFEPRYSGSIIVLDDVREQTGILDRWFTNLYLAGHLLTCKAVALGQFVDCGPKNSANMLSVMDVFSDRLKYLEKISCFGLPIGQTKHAHPVPLGISARLSSADGLLEFSESALV